MRTNRSILTYSSQIYFKNNILNIDNNFSNISEDNKVKLKSLKFKKNNNDIIPFNMALYYESTTSSDIMNYFKNIIDFTADLYIPNLNSDNDDIINHIYYSRIDQLEYILLLVHQFKNIDVNEIAKYFSQNNLNDKYYILLKDVLSLFLNRTDTIQLFVNIYNALQINNFNLDMIEKYKNYIDTNTFIVPECDYNDFQKLAIFLIKYNVDISFIYNLNINEYVKQNLIGLYTSFDKLHSYSEIFYNIISKFIENPQANQNTITEILALYIKLEYETNLNIDNVIYKQFVNNAISKINDLELKKSLTKMSIHILNEREPTNLVYVFELLKDFICDNIKVQKKFKHLISKVPSLRKFLFEANLPLNIKFGLEQENEEIIIDTLKYFDSDSMTIIEHQDLDEFKSLNCIRLINCFYKISEAEVMNAFIKIFKIDDTFKILYDFNKNYIEAVIANRISDTNIKVALEFIKFTKADIDEELIKRIININEDDIDSETESKLLSKNDAFLDLTLAQFCLCSNTILQLFNK